MNASRLPLVKNTRLVFFGVFLIGFAACTTGIGQASARGLWTHPVTIAGYALGASALVLAGSVLLHRPIGPITNERRALAVLFGIIVMKFLLAALYRLM